MTSPGVKLGLSQNSQAGTLAGQSEQSSRSVTLAGVNWPSVRAVKQVGAFTGVKLVHCEGSDTGR